MIEKATSAVKETPFLEFRLDYLEKPLLALPRFKQFFAENTAATVIATCRRTVNGGKFAGSLAAELEILTKCAAAGFHLVDLELESAEAMKKADLQKLRETGIGLLISYHDFMGTHDLDGIFNRSEAFSPDFIKVVPTAKALYDNVTLIRFLERMNDATVGEETGPGQIASRTLIETYRIDQVDAATKIYGVAGNPIRSSLSPIMMNTAFRRETVNAVYLALQTARLSDLLKLVYDIPIQGVSVTMPLKQEIMAHLERTDPLSARIGACNTVLRAQDGKLYGFNTDVAGITGPLEKRMPLAGAKVLVLGAGGAARAAVFGLREKGANVFILNRTAETAQKLARQSGSKTIRKEALAKTSFDAIINATPVGMAGNKTAPLLEARDLNTRLVFDLVYNPLETPLLHLARQLSIPIITGVEMFVHQGARQFEIWTGKPAPEEEMFRVVLHALRQQAEAAAEAVESKPETKPKPSAKTVAKPAAKQKPEAKPKADAKPEARAAAKPKSETKPKPAAKSPAKQAAKKAAKPKPQAKSPAKKSAAKAKK
jgi:3-dehydroquinate dehydratase/shikimate dehydrogenase